MDRQNALVNRVRSGSRRVEINGVLELIPTGNFESDKINPMAGSEAIPADCCETGSKLEGEAE